jgi:hypothetical protein
MNLRKGNMKYENGNLQADPQSVLNRWKNFFNQVSNIHWFMMLGRWIYIWLSHWCQNLALSTWKLLLES